MGVSKLLACLAYRGSLLVGPAGTQPPAPGNGAIGGVEGIQQGLAKGRLEGRQEGEALFLLRLLERRFGPVDETVREQVRNADVEILLTWGGRVLTAKSPGDVFQD